VVLGMNLFPYFSRGCQGPFFGRSPCLTADCEVFGVGGLLCCGLLVFWLCSVCARVDFSGFFTAVLLIEVAAEHVVVGAVGRFQSVLALAEPGFAQRSLEGRLADGFTGDHRLEIV